jgi:hypothetical protein
MATNSPTRLQLLVMRAVFFASIAAISVVCFAPFLCAVLWWTLLYFGLITLDAYP